MENTDGPIKQALARALMVVNAWLRRLNEKLSE